MKITQSVANRKGSELNLQTKTAQSIVGKNPPGGSLSQNNI